YFCATSRWNIICRDWRTHFWKPSELRRRRSRARWRECWEDSNLSFMKTKKIVVCGGGGFIGGHLIADLLKQGEQDVRAVDIKPFAEWHQHFPQIENLELDLQDRAACEEAMAGAAVV